MRESVSSKRCASMVGLGEATVEREGAQGYVNDGVCERVVKEGGKGCASGGEGTGMIAVRLRMGACVARKA